MTRSLPLSSPFGPTFGCSISRLPRRSIVFPVELCAIARVFFDCASILSQTSSKAGFEINAFFAVGEWIFPFPKAKRG